MALLTVHEDLKVSFDVLQRPVDHDYSHVDKLGSGTSTFFRSKFAVVKKMKHKNSGKDFAVKLMRKRRGGRACREEILREIAILKMAQSHSRIVQLVEIFETPTEIAVVMEYAAGGELHYLLQDSFTEMEAVSIVRQIVEALQFLHEKNIVHCDIKPQNILLTEKFPDGHVKLIDFGLSRVVSNGMDVREIAGTTDYLAPEILDYEPITSFTDMWSLGVLTYVLLSNGYSPFAGDTKEETLLNISQVNLDFPKSLFDNTSTPAIDFIEKLLIKNPRKRMLALQCLNHPWLRQGEAKLLKYYQPKTSDSDFGYSTDTDSEPGDPSTPKSISPTGSDMYFSQRINDEHLARVDETEDLEMTRESSLSPKLQQSLVLFKMTESPSTTPEPEITLEKLGTSGSQIFRQELTLSSISLSASCPADMDAANADPVVLIDNFGPCPVDSGLSSCATELSGLDQVDQPMDNELRGLNSSLDHDQPSFDDGRNLLLENQLAADKPPLSRCYHWCTIL